jgi:metal-responsive CopG/Arc/MetJ family transcriptional regulator
MAEGKKTVKIVLNQQQLELMDATITRAGVTTREDLVRMALREFFAQHGAPGVKTPGEA